MVILGIDYGKRKIGLALSETILSEPYAVLKVASLLDGVEKVKKVIEKEKVDLVVIGNPGGIIGQEVRRFIEKLKEKTLTEIVMEDERYTTQEAQVLAIEAKIKRKKRKLLEDAFTAVVILQRYLDSY